MLSEPGGEPVIDAALFYASFGLRVIPIIPGRKHPQLAEWQDVATCEEAIIIAWWTGLYRGHGVGVVTGEESGVWVLDIDVADGKRGAASLAALEAEHGPLPATVEAITGTGGRHLYFKWDPAHPVRNDQAGHIGDGIDVRGEGGQVVAAPTLHAVTRMPYVWRLGRSFADMVPAEAPAWLYALREAPLALVGGDRAPSVIPAPLMAPPRLSGAGDDDSAAGAFNAATTWAGLLGRDGWTLARVVGPESRWTRPGKSAAEGISATVGHQGRDCLHVFTSSVRELQPDATYSRFGYEVAIRYGANTPANRSAFARELRNEMNARARDELDAWWAKAVMAPAQLTEVEPEPTPVAPSAPVDDWPDPEPLEPELTHGPPFPVEVLPAWMADMAEEIAEAVLVPVDLPAVGALGALATIAMTHVTVQVAGTTWTEGTNLYLMAGYRSGGGKSPAFNAVMAPIEAFEAERIDQMAPAISEATARAAVAAKAAKVAEDAAAKGKITIAEAIAVAAAGLALEAPASPALLVEDITPESLGQHIDECGGLAALLSAEGDVVDMMGGQYAGEGKGANLGVYLKAWGGESIRVKRIGRGVIRLPSATLTITVMPQPVLIRRLGGNAELGERGITARFLYVIPADNIGTRDFATLLRPPGAEVRQTYEDRLLGLARRLAGSRHPMALRTSPEATEAWVVWLNETEARLRPGADLEAMAAWVAKLRGSTLRLAALLHVADDHGQDEPVGVEALSRAFVLADYWIAHARIVHGAWADAVGEDVLGVCRHILRWATLEGPRAESFTVSEAHLECRRHRRGLKIAVVNEAIEYLVDRGWVRVGDDFPGSPGRRSPDVQLHPRAIWRLV